jgi:Flp pilus assembly protein TadG
MPISLHGYPRQAQRIAALSRFARRLLTDARGAVLVEFGIVAVPFFALIFSTLLSALIMFAQQALDTTAEAVAREIMTGQVQKGSVKVIDPVTGNPVNIDSNAKLKTRVCDQLKANGVGFLTCGNVMVSLKKLATFSAADYNPVTLNFNPTTGAVTNAPGTFDTIGQEEIGLVTVYYRWPKLMGPLLGFTTGNQSNGERLMVSNAIFKTETYNQ